MNASDVIYSEALYPAAVTGPMEVCHRFLFQV